MDGRKVPLTDNSIIEQVIYGVPGSLVFYYRFSLAFCKFSNFSHAGIRKIWCCLHRGHGASAI